MAKCKVLAVLGTPYETKKKDGAKMLKVCVAYPDANAGTHVIYAKDGDTLNKIKVGEVLDLDLRYQEICSIVKAA